MEINMIGIGERIRMRRNELGLSQTDIYHKCGIASGVLSRIENGKNTPSIIAFYKLAQTLDCDMTWLVTGISANMQNVVLCKSEEDLINGFRKLPFEDQDEFIEILNVKLRKTQKERNSSAKSSASNHIGSDSLVG